MRIGLSILSAAHNPIVPRLMALLKERGAHGILVVLGATIPPRILISLTQQGVAAIFGPGMLLETTVEFIRANVNPRGLAARPKMTSFNPRSAPAPPFPRCGNLRPISTCISQVRFANVSNITCGSQSNRMRRVMPQKAKSSRRSLSACQHFPRTSSAIAGRCGAIATRRCAVITPSRSSNNPFFCS